VRELDALLSRTLQLNSCPIFATRDEMAVVAHPTLSNVILDTVESISNGCRFRNAVSASTALSVSVLSVFMRAAFVPGTDLLETFAYRGILLHHYFHRYLV
jgi:hypothetical protein